MEFELLSRAKENPIYSAVGIIVVLVAAGFLFSILGVGQLAADDGGFQQESLDRYQGPVEADNRVDDIPDAPEFEIRTGSIEIESEDASSDVSLLREELDGFNGRISSEDKRETSRYIEQRITVNIETEKFESFVEWLENEYDVESTRVQYETVEADRKQNQVDVLLEAMDVYDRMLEQVNSSEELSPDEIEVVSELTRERSKVAEQLNELGYELEQLERQEQESEVELRFREELDVEIRPENVRNELRSEISDSVDSLVDTSATVVSVPIDMVSWFLLALRYVLLGLVAAVPVVLGVKLLQRIYRA